MTRVNFKRAIKNAVPASRWLSRYKAEDALGDLVAGLTVGLTLIPQVLSTLKSETRADVTFNLRSLDARSYA